MQSDKPNNLPVILTLMLTIIVDIMGIGLIFPIMSHLFLGPHAYLMAEGTSEFWRTFDYGVSLAAWPVGLFFGAPYLGKLSDKYGRKPLLLLCLFGVAISYMLAAVAVMWHSLALFIVARLLSGYFAGSFELAQAVIVDISLPENKVRNMSWITLSACTGFVIGPVISGFTAPLGENSIFGISWPLWIAAGLSILNTVSLLLLLKERFETRHHMKISPLSAFTTCAFGFIDRRVKRLNWGFFFQQAGWGLFVFAIPLFVEKQYQWGVFEQAWLFSASGMGMIVTLVLVQPFLFKRYSMKSCAVVLTFIEVLLLLFFMALPVAWNQFFTLVLVGMANLIGYSVLLAFFSGAVTEEEQGLVLGCSGSSFALSQFMAALLSGLLIELSAVSYLAVAALFLFIFGWILIGYQQPKAA